MPPKAKDKKKGKQSVVVDGLSTEEMSKDQLWDHMICLREELDRVREEKSYFQLERDKAQAVYEIRKRTLEETKARLRIRQREKEEAEERHRVEITTYKQKLKNVLSEQHSTVSGLKMDAFTAASLIQNQNAETELGLQGEVHSLQASYRKKMFHNENCIKEIKLKQQVELMELINDYDRKFRDMAVKYHKKMQSGWEEHNRKKSAELLEVEERGKSDKATMLEDHKRAMQHYEDLFDKAKVKHLEQLQDKEEMVELKKKLAREDRKLAAAVQENKRLQRSLQESKERLPQLKKQLEEHKKDKTKMLKSTARVKVIKKELDDLSMEHMLLQQDVEKEKQERDKLLKKKKAAILDAEQQCALKEMVLERKVAALKETLETKEAQLCAVLSTSNIDQTAASSAAKKLEKTLESKSLAISALKGELARDCEKYDELLQRSKESLKARGVPLYNFPFKTSGQILRGRTRVQKSPSAVGKL
ncbi:dynein regulatory complex subunit 4-like [Labrus mixtus]|uniref:dynein regulatory complex subunit 4-like n=1 Tax=Labrus mixtus TaxID=508554 RepID=UPI0029C0685F|nr:dynein regulatory complex subunit 4-like [Labrus mixtus]